jgi:hypothetical protein
MDKEYNVTEGELWLSVPSNEKQAGNAQIAPRVLEKETLPSEFITKYTNLSNSILIISN